MSNSVCDVYVIAWECGVFLFSFVWGKRRKSSINEVNPFNLCHNIYGNACLRYFMLLKKGGQTLNCWTTFQKRLKRMKKEIVYLDVYFFPGAKTSLKSSPFIYDGLKTPPIFLLKTPYIFWIANTVWDCNWSAEQVQNVKGTSFPTWVKKCL